MKTRLMTLQWAVCVTVHRDNAVVMFYDSPYIYTGVCDWTMLLLGQLHDSLLCDIVCLSVCLSPCLSVCFSVCLSVRLTDKQTDSLSVFLSVCLSACLSVCLCLCICLSVCVTVTYWGHLCEASVTQTDIRRCVLCVYFIYIALTHIFTTVMTPLHVMWICTRNCSMLQMANGDPKNLVE